MRLTSDGRPNPSRRGYTYRWKLAALRYRKHHTACAMFGIDPKCTGVATCVDHIKPHGGEKRGFFDKRNWQALCTGCHNRKTARERSSGLKVDVDGMPAHWQEGETQWQNVKQTKRRR